MTYARFISLKLLLISLLTFISCQEEIEPEIKIDVNGIASDDLIARSIVAVATKDGSEDNIIDHSSCTTVRFPITGIIEEEEVVFETLEEVKSFRSGALEIDWLFPWEVILSDHSQITVNSEDDLEAIQDQCEEEGDDSDNECIDFIYPFTIQVFDKRTESLDVREVSDDREAYVTFSSPDLITTIEFPVNMINSVGELLESYSNDELVTAITNAPDLCDEEDNVDFEEVFEEELTSLFTSKSWFVNVYEESGDDNTAQFSGYILSFDADQSLRSQGPAIVDGEWDLELSDFEEKIAIAFDTEDHPLVLLNESWTIRDFDQNQITLQYQDSENVTKELQLSSQ